MPFVRYVGERNRINIGGRYFYRHQRKQQTTYGNYIDDDFLKKNEKALKASGCIIYRLTAGREREILEAREKSLKEQARNRDASERRRDMYFCAHAGINDLAYLNELAEVYQADKEVLNLVEATIKSLERQKKHLAAQGKIIKEIHKLVNVDKIRALAEEHKDDPDIQEAADSHIEYLKKVRPQIMQTIRESESPEEIKNLLKVWKGDSDVETVGKDKLEALAKQKPAGDQK